MSYSAKILEKLYNAEKITAYGLRKAVEDGVITEEEYTLIITGN